jgi:predicted DCC family thiol-disulfide oxidoreductase YuxK
MAQEVMMNTDTPLEVFYDGSCIVCAREMESYRRRVAEQRLVFVDISAAEFVATDYGLSQAEFMRELKVRDATGRFYSGVDAFVALWRTLPDGSFYRLLAELVPLPGVRFAAGLGYRLFARYRHLLPRRGGDCGSSSCGLGHDRHDRH